MEHWFAPSVNYPPLQLSAGGECVLMFCTSVMKLLCSQIQAQHTAAALISCSGTWADSFRVWFQYAGLAVHSRFASPALGTEPELYEPAHHVLHV